MTVTVQQVGEDHYTVTASEAIWSTIMTRLVQDNQSHFRNAIAHQLSDEALPTPTPGGEVHQGVSVSEPELDHILKVGEWDDHHGPTIDFEYLEAIDEPTTPAPKKRAPRQPGSKQLNDCACGCGGKTASKWVPGHDSRYKSGLIKRVDQNADEGAADELVERGWWKQDRAESRIKAALENA